jgi:DNA-binding NarL/FixJ family response regulator
MWMTEQWEVAPAMPRKKKMDGLLSDRERHIVALVGRGCTNRQIAQELKLTQQTVKNRLTVIYDKLQVRGRVRLAVFALEQEIH